MNFNRSNKVIWYNYLNNHRHLLDFHHHIPILLQLLHLNKRQSAWVQFAHYLGYQNLDTTDLTSMADMFEDDAKPHKTIQIMDQHHLTVGTDFDKWTNTIWNRLISQQIGQIRHGT